MELVPATVLKDEYVALQTAIYQQHAPERALGSWSVAIDVFAAFLVDQIATIGTEIAAGAISSASRKTLSDQLATLGNPSGPAVDKDLDNALTVMASVQAYLERMC